MEKFDIIAKTLFGFEEILASELKTIGAEDIEVLNRAVKYRGDNSVLYKSNLHLRTAIKILKPIAYFKIDTQNDLYDKLVKINWDKYFSVNQTFAVDGVTSGELFTHSKYVALKAKDAIVDRFRERKNKRPNVETNNPDIRFNVHIINNSCTISIDSSGVSLGKRGYKLEQTEAPLSEVMAAGMVLLSGWDKNTNFIDPMCGSGTIAIEAALIAQNTPPGIFRDFAFEKWRDFDQNLWEKILQEAKDNIIKCEAKITASDNNQEAVHITKANARRAGVENIISVKLMNFLESEAENEHATIIINPPYGERLEDIEKITPLYQEIGTHLKHSYNGSDAWILSGNLESIKFIGLRPSRKIELYNGPIKCKYHKFELYKGSKKTAK